MENSSSKGAEEYQLAEDYFTDHTESTSEVEYESADKYFSEEENGSNFRINTQCFTNKKRLRHEDTPESRYIVRKKCCERECFKVIETVSCEAKADLKDRFKCKLISQKNLLLDHLRSTRHVQMEMYTEDKNFFYFEHYKICCKTYSDLTGVSTYVLNSVMLDFNNGRKVKYEHGNLGRGRISAAGANCVAFVLEFSRKYAQDSPDEKLVVLPKIFILSELYHIYQSEVKGKLVTKNSFFKLFKLHFGPYRKNRDFPRIRISKYSSHARCDECVKLQEARKNVKCAADLALVRRKTEAHRLEYSGARIEVNRLLLLCQTFPRDYLGKPLIH